MKLGTLLIVDDEPDLVSSLSLILSDSAENILTAADGFQALEVLSKEKIHCVLCDINMPRMNGVEVLREIRSKNNQVPFILYTGHGSRALMMEVSKLGAFDFLDKPMLEGLVETVERGLSVGVNGEAPNNDGSFMSEYQKLLNSAE